MATAKRHVACVYAQAVGHVAIVAAVPSSHSFRPLLRVRVPLIPSHAFLTQRLQKRKRSGSQH
jgi:hypothetical protein